MKRAGFVVVTVAAISVAFASGALLAGTESTPSRTPAQKRAASVKDAWLELGQHETGNACGDDLIFDYGAGGGMRNLFCRTLTFFSWKTFLKIAPAPFRAGPHKNGRLKLNSERDFGRYDPKFARWAVDHLVPGAADPAFREQTQGTYDKQMRTLARSYYEVWRAVSSDKAWLEREVNVYLRAADDASVAWDSRVVDLYHDILGTGANDWGGHDPNLVRSATMYWLRRTKDGTASVWLEGLEKLLGAYDAKWLADTKAKPFAGKLPVRASTKEPEYR